VRTLMAQQPNYAPYLGFFDRAARADVVVLQDDLNYTKQEWQNRNRIRSRDSWRWLTIPVHGSHRRAIQDTHPVDGLWLARHMRILRQEYPGAQSHERVDDLASELAPFRTAPLAIINETLIRYLLRMLSVSVHVVRESELGIPQIMEPNRRLMLLCDRLGCERYLSGMGAHNYIQPDLWRAADVYLDEHLFVPVPYGEHRERWQPNLSVLDLVLLAENSQAEFARTQYQSSSLPWGTRPTNDKVVLR
jgi:WbqC-like protein